MRRAICLAQKGEGKVNPNPLVGAVIVKDGKIIDIVAMEEIHNRPFREYYLKFGSKKDYELVKSKVTEILEDHPDKNGWTVKVPNERIDLMFEQLRNLDLVLIKEIQYTLEKYFMQHVVKGDNK